MSNCNITVLRAPFEGIARGGRYRVVFTGTKARFYSMSDDTGAYVPACIVRTAINTGAFVVEH